MSKLNRKSVLASVVAAAALAWAPASLAQGAQGGAPQGQGAPQTQPPGTGAGQVQIDDGTLDRFASAFVEIQEISDDYSGRLQNVNDREQAMELQRQAQSEMLEVVRQNDLSVREYNQVATLMNENPEIRERVNQKIGEQ